MNTPGVVPSARTASRRAGLTRDAAGPVLDAQQRIGEMLVYVHPHHLQQHVRRTVPARHGRCQAAQRHDEQVHRGLSGVKPLLGGKAVGELVQLAEIPGQYPRAR
jgi:hypothetical protein